MVLVLLECSLKACLQCIHIGGDQQCQVIALGQHHGLLHHHILVGSIGNGFLQLGLNTGLCQLLQGRTEVFCQLPEMVDFLAEMPEFSTDLYTHKKMKSNPDVAKQALAFVKPVLEGITDWSETTLHDVIMEAIPQTGMKNATVLWPLRIAVTGKQATPGGAFEMLYLLGKDEAMKRLNDAMAKL